MQEELTFPWLNKLQLLLAGLIGFAVLTLEVLGMHWLAPWFGSSSLVWANQIGVVLLAMALGGWAGAVTARKDKNLNPLIAKILIGAGVWILISIPLLPPLANALLPEQLLFEEAAFLFLSGALSASLLFFSIPVFLLSMATPLLVELRGAKRGAGRAAGELAAAGTLGSLFGVFGGTFLGIPFVGVELTFVFTAFLLLSGAWFLCPKKTVAAFFLFGLIPFVSSASADDANLPADAKVLAVTQSSYQRLRVIEFPASGERWLQMNEGLDSYQSRWNPGGGWPGGYYDVMGLTPLFAQTEKGQPVAGWLIGLGAGSGIYPLAHALQQNPWTLTGVEIDPQVWKISQAYLPLTDALQDHLQVLTGMDGRAALRLAPQNLDFIMVDAYSNQFEIPMSLATVEFFREVHGKLRVGGVFAFNVGARQESLSQESKFLLAGLAEVFGGFARGHQVPHTRNAVLFARKELPLMELVDIAPALVGFPKEVGAALLPGQTYHAEPLPNFRYTDSRNPLALDQAKHWWTLRGW